MVDPNIRALLLLAVLFSVSACSRLPAQDTSSSSEKRASPTNDDTAKRLDDLKYSKLCSDAAEKFWTEHNWKDNTDPDTTNSYTSHYNKAMNKCFVDVHGVHIRMVKKKVVESDHIYDALENKVIAARWLTKSDASPDAVIEGMVLIKDGRPIRSKEEAAAFLPWFESLMNQ